MVAVVSVQGVTVHIIIYIIIQDKVLRPNNKVLVVMARDKKVRSLDSCTRARGTVTVMS